MAVLITNANSEWGGGLAWGGGACSVDTNSGTDWGTVVWYSHSFIEFFFLIK